MKKSGKTRRQLLLAGLGSLGAQLAPGEARAQDAAKVMPRTYRVALENDKLRVLEFTGRPGMGICGESMHSHPDHLTIVLADFQGKVTTPDGKVQDRKRKLDWRLAREWRQQEHRVGFMERNAVNKKSRGARK